MTTVTASGQGEAEDSRGPAPASMPDCSPAQPCPDAVTVWGSVASIISALAVAGLTSRQTEIVLLRMAGMSYKEIARFLSTNHSAVRWDLCTARRALGIPRYADNTLLARTVAQMARRQRGIA